MAAVKKNSSVAPTVRAAYDRMADVLYITLGAQVPAEGDGRPGGIELDYALSDRSPCGATVVGYRLNRWPEKGDELVREIAQHLAVSSSELAAAVKAATG